jgi:hypothetical protein
VINDLACQPPLTVDVRRVKAGEPDSRSVDVANVIELFRLDYERR